MVPMIRVDWANHLIYGLLAFILCAALALAAGFGDYRMAAGVAASVAIGAAKELLDWRSNRRAAAEGATPTHSVDLRDFTATLAGGALGAWALLLGKW